MKKGTKVLVTTNKDRRGVFGGLLESRDTATGTCVLTQARMAIHWPRENHGVLALAAIGPVKGARITPMVPRLELDGVTAVAEMTPAAWAAWEAETWS